MKTDKSKIQSFFIERECIECSYLPLWKKCQYTASSWHELEKTPPLDLEICLSRDNAPLIPQSWKSLLRQNPQSLGGVFSNTSLLSAVYYYILHRRKEALVSQTIKIIGLQSISTRISAAVLNERLFLCMSADNEEAIWLTYKFNSSFPSLCCRHPLRWPSVPNQTSTTGKNLIIAHPDSVAMDDAFLSRS